MPMGYICLGRSLSTRRRKSPFRSPPARWMLPPQETPMHSDPLAFKRCSTCRQSIAWGAKYFTCSVSTCNRARIGLFFCSIPCWEAHLPEARHRDAWAEEQKAPTEAEALEEATVTAQTAPPRRRVVGESAAPDAASAEPGELPEDVLVVTSKLKAYVRARSAMSTSDRVVSVLSEHLRRVMTQSIREAASQDRKTVLDRDVEVALARLLK